MKVDQLLASAGPFDAVTMQALAYRRRFRSWGWTGREYAPVIVPGLPRGAAHPLARLRDRADVLIVHFSGFVREWAALRERRAPVLLVSHNVTPPAWFWEHSPVEAAACELAREQLAELAGWVAVPAGVSRFNARELEAMSGRPAEVLPILFEPGDDSPGVAGGEGATAGGEGATAADGEGATAGGEGPSILFVGRLVPHKRQDLAIRAFARLRRRCPDARLDLVGSPLTPEYGQALQRLAEELAPGAVRFHTGVTPERLRELYRQAAVFLCLSEHEGFCIPLLEAFAAGLPVIARAAAAVPEVTGDAALLLAAGDGIEVIAQALEIVLEDAELRGELRERGGRRLRAYDPDEVAALIRASVEAMA